MGLKQSSNRDIQQVCMNRIAIVPTLILEPQSDAYWVFERFKQYATRMEILPISDLSRSKSLDALSRYRSRFFKETPSPKVLEEVYAQVGGRLAYLSRVARSPDMLQMCDHIRKVEKTWFLNQCWILGETMDEGIYSFIAQISSC